jgi:hypothetical protein
VATVLSRLGKTVIVEVRVVVKETSVAIQQHASSQLPTMLSVILAMKIAAHPHVSFRGQVQFAEQAQEPVILRRHVVALLLLAQWMSMLLMVSLEILLRY